MPIDSSIGMPIIECMTRAMHDNITALIAHFGGPTATSKAIGVSQPTVTGWEKGIHGISAKNALKIQYVTNGKFQAADLCPDLLPSGQAVA